MTELELRFGYSLSEVERGEDAGVPWWGEKMEGCRRSAVGGCRDGSGARERG